MTLYRLAPFFFLLGMEKNILFPHTKGRTQPNTSIYYTTTTAALTKDEMYSGGYSLTDSSTVGTLAVKGWSLQ